MRGYFCDDGENFKELYELLCQQFTNTTLNLERT